MKSTHPRRFIEPQVAYAKHITLLLCALAVASAARAQAPDTSESTDTRYGPLKLLDSRSGYGQGVYPEPFLVDDSDLEVNEARLDWVYQASKGATSNALNAEIEKGFGELTLEIEGHYEYDTAASFDAVTDRTDRQISQAFENPDIGARLPFYQYVSADNFFDTTFGAGIEIGIPINTPLSKNAEIVPKVFNDTRLGEHFTLQSIFGYSMLLGSGEDGGVNTFEYGFDFGYTIYHDDLPLPGVEQMIPVLELAGETTLNHADAGHNSLTGNAAVRFNLRSIGRVQPRLGVGYIFPIDQGARDDFRWGIITSLVFEF